MPHNRRDETRFPPVATRFRRRIWSSQGGSGITRRWSAESDQGFTLIELLVVVVIIGILIAIAVPLYLNFENGSKNSSAETDVHNAVVIVNQCEADNGGDVPADPTGNGVLNATLVFACPDADHTQKATVSPGNTLTFADTGSGHFTITGSNTTGGKTYKYDSATGLITTT